MRVVASYFRTKAELCRGLAHALRDQDDPVVSRLHDMADEFDENARILERRIARDETVEDVSGGDGNVH